MTAFDSIAAGPARAGSNGTGTDGPQQGIDDRGMDGRPDLLRRAALPADTPQLAQRLAEALGTDVAFSAVILFASPDTDRTALLAAARGRFGAATLVGCTTAGEIAEGGYIDGHVVAIGLPDHAFRAEAVLFDDLTRSPVPDLTARVQAARNRLRDEAASWVHEFAFLMIDGLSLREDQLASELAASLGPVPLFGGSAGDGETFTRTEVFHAGRALTDAAVVLLVRTRCPVRVFKTDHLMPSDRRMVVTRADPDTRTVHQINAAPAGPEYARILGLDPAQLSTFTFAAHPVVLRLGAQHHVRSIQQVKENGDLVFFSAIDEGIVLSLADARDMIGHLEQELGALAAERTPLAVLACDCVLRKVEAQQKQALTGLSEILARHRVTGFSTYGEQVGAMHVNQTLTGVAIYPPEDDG